MSTPTTARAAALLLTIIAAIPVCGQSAAGVPSLTPDDLILEEGRDGGYHLWVRDKPGLGSVLLTEGDAVSGIHRGCRDHCHCQGRGKSSDAVAENDPQPRTPDQRSIIDRQIVEDAISLIPNITNEEVHHKISIG